MPQKRRPVSALSPEEKEEMFAKDMRAYFWEVGGIITFVTAILWYTY